MKGKRKSMVWALGVACTTAFAQAPNGHTLTVYAENFQSANGQSVANLFVKGESLKQRPNLQMRSPIVAGRAVFEFKNLVYGEYAVILWHDKNSDADLNHRFGIPSEPLGYSNGWSFGLFSGMPTFEKLKFSFSEQTNVISIKIN